MPDLFGHTDEELNHYGSVINQTEGVLRAAKANPFVQAAFDAAMKKLTEAYNKIQNGLLSKGLPLNQIYDVFQNRQVKGVIPQIEEEIRNAKTAKQTAKILRNQKKAAMSGPI